MQPTASERLVQILAELGVRHVFGVVGDALNSFTDALAREERVRWVGVRHEEAGAFAAGAQAQLGAPVGVCAGTVGPGAIHLLNGLYDAKKSFAPVLAITGQVPSDEIGGEFHQEVDLHRLFGDVAVYHQTATSADHVPRIARIALRTAIAKRGVAVLSIPGDIGPARVSGKAAAHASFLPRSLSVPCARELDELAARVLESEKTTLLVGAGAAGARASVEALATALQAPIAASLRGKEVAECLQRFYVGQTGLIGNPAAHRAIHEADLLLMIGTDLPYRDWLPQEESQVVQIDLDASHLGRRCPLAQGLVGDAGATLDALLERVEPARDSRFLEAVTADYAAWRKGVKEVATHEEGLVRGAVQRATNPSGRLRPEEVALAVGELAAPNAVFAADVGMCTVWASRCLELGEEQRLITSFNLASMANALPQAIGAQLQDPDRQVIALCGDGGFTMLMGELLTAVTENLPLKIILFDNASYGMVKLEQKVAGLTPSDTELENPDFARVAEAMGALGLRVEESAELQPALAAVFAHDGPAVLDAVTNADALAMPPEFTLDQAWGFATSKLKDAVISVRSALESNP